MDLKIKAAMISWHFPRLSKLSVEELLGLSKSALYTLLLQQKLISGKNEFQRLESDVQSDLEWLTVNQAKTITAFDVNYPQQLHALKNPPLILTYFGNLNFSYNFLSIVGSRNPSGESSQWLDAEISKLLTKTSLCIVSGGARGVDQKAHSLALRHQLPTIMFLPSGLAKMYPKNIYSWVSLITEGGGAVVSQFSPFQDMRKHYFHMRNQIIASLSNSILIIDAKRRSGTMMTANYASSLGKDVFVLPGAPIYESSLGGLDLIYDGAYLVRDHHDLLQTVEITK